MKKEQTVMYDCIIVGAGIAGLSAAYHLAKDGRRVLVLEKFHGKDNASWASTADMDHDPSANWQRIISRFGLSGAKDLWKLSELGIQKLIAFAHRPNAPQFETRRLPAYVFTYHTSNRAKVIALQEKYRLYKKIGAPVSFDHDGRALHKNFRSVLTIQDEGQTNNQMLVKGLRRALRKLHGTILYGESVQNLVITSGIVELTTATGNTFAGKRVILATGDQRLLPDIARDITPRRTFVVSYKKHGMDALFRSSISWDMDDPYHYIRSFGGSRLWVGGEDILEKYFKKHDEKKYFDALDRYAGKVLGVNASYKRETGWSGTYFSSARGLPYIGDVPGTPISLSVGFGDTGVVMSFVSGFLLAAWQKNKETRYRRLFGFW